MDGTMKSIIRTSLKFVARMVFAVLSLIAAILAGVFVFEFIAASLGFVLSRYGWISWSN